MSPESKRPLPADMLLFIERRRRLAAAPATARPAEPFGGLPAQGGATEEEDVLIEEAGTEAHERRLPSYLPLYLPLAHVVVGNLERGGSIDHQALQAAIACSADQRETGPTLFAALDRDELAAIEAAARRFQESATLLRTAAALPVTIIGAESALIAAARPAFVAYRRCALLLAWHIAFGSAAPPDLIRERDIAGLRVLAVLRALIGEA